MKFYVKPTRFRPTWFRPIPTITQTLKKVFNVEQIEDFFEYLSCGDTTWGSYKTITLLEVTKFKTELKNYTDNLTGFKYTEVNRKINKFLDGRRYLIIE